MFAWRLEMLIAASFLAVALSPVASGAWAAAPDHVGLPAAGEGQKPIAIEIVNDGPIRKGSLLDLLLPIRDDNSSEAERSLGFALRGRPWIDVVMSDGEVAVAIVHAHRREVSRSESKDRSKVTVSYRYTVRAAIARRGERDEITQDVDVSTSYSSGSSRRSPTSSDDHIAFERTGRELAVKVREWLLPRLPSLRPDGLEVGFRHVNKFKWIVKGDGLEVTEVQPGSPADTCGLRPGDRIKKIDRESGTLEMSERVWTWRFEPGGATAQIEIERDKQRQMLRLELPVPTAGPRRGR
jgi:hypothetical protein